MPTHSQMREQKCLPGFVVREAFLSEKSEIVLRPTAALKRRTLSDGHCDIAQWQTKHDVQYGINSTKHAGFDSELD
jgi:hypothetical protein